MPAKRPIGRVVLLVAVVSCACGGLSAGDLTAPGIPTEPSLEISPGDRLSVLQLIEKLGSPDYADRTAATAHLKAKDKRLTEELLRIYPTIEDHEVRLRLHEIAEHLFYRDALAELGGFLGIRMQPASVADATVVQIEIAAVIPGTAAESAGLIAGDLIVELNGAPIAATPDPRLTQTFASKIGGMAPGEEIQLMLVRGGAKLAKRFRLGVRPLPLALQSIDSLRGDQRTRLENAGRAYSQWCAELERQE